MDTVTHALLDRSRDSQQVLRAMLAVSLAAHAALFAAMTIMPGMWPEPADTAIAPVMTISLGGAPGPRAGGMSPLGGRTVQQVAPESKPRPSDAPPAAKTPEMTMPAPNQRVRKPAPVTSAPKEATGRTPATGTTAEAGSTVADTGGRGMGFGLTTGGGGGTGGYLDVADFCCPEWLSTMVELVQRNWTSRQGLAGENLVKFTILRDGTIDEVELERSSGYTALDLTSRRALLLTRQVPPLPTGYPGDRLTVHLKFEYRR